jgi:hypothetical protein
MRLSLFAAIALVGCAEAPPPAAAPAAVALRPADLELQAADTAVVGGRPVAFDGEAEGLSWPNLERALPRKPGEGGEVTIAVTREARMRDLLRAAWTLRAADVRVQTRDAAGKERGIVLHTKPTFPSMGCHVAIFVGDTGVRVSSPSGSPAPAGPLATVDVVRWVHGLRAGCPIRYVAFGAESNDSPWGAVFDVVIALDDARAAGPTRYVLAEAMAPR